MNGIYWLNVLGAGKLCNIWKSLQKTTNNQNELWSAVPKDTSTNTLVSKVRGTLKKREQRDYLKNQRIRE